MLIEGCQASRRAANGVPMGSAHDLLSDVKPVRGSTRMRSRGLG